MTRLLITGATGFIGAALVARLRDAGVAFNAAARKMAPGVTHRIGDLAGPIDWAPALEEVSTVVHLAGPAHTAISDNFARRAIAGATAELARQASASGVSRFVYLSSIRAVARASDAPLTEAASPRPLGAYGQAKREAEEAVLARPELHAVVLRPPLVIAPHAGANWRKLMQAAASGAPLPFAGLGNRRSLIALASLIDAILAAIAAPKSSRGVFHLADRPALSTEDIIRALRTGMGRPPRLFQAPWLAALAPSQLRENLEIDASAFEQAFAWRGGDARAAVVACGRDWSAR